MSSKDELYRGYPYSMLKLRVVIALHELKAAVEIWLRAMTTDWLLMPIQRHYQFNPSTEGSISKFLFEIVCSASSSTNVDALTFRLLQYDKFYSGEQQVDASECLKMLIKLINKGSVPYCGYNDINSTGVSLSEILFSLMLEKYIVCDACGLRSPFIWV